MSNDVNSFIMGGGGAKSAALKNEGDTIRGTIVSTEVRQQTEFGTNAPKTWDDGSPMMQVVVTLQTDEHDDDDDDGLRRIYLKGGLKSPTTQRAVADAIRKAGAKGLEIGGTLALKLTGFGEAPRKGFNPPGQYAAKYEPPAKVVAVDDFEDDSAPF